MIIRLCLLQCLCAIFYFFHLADANLIEQIQIVTRVLSGFKFQPGFKPNTAATTADASSSTPEWAFSVDTAALVEKIETALANTDARFGISDFGRFIYFKSKDNKKCLESKQKMGNDKHFHVYYTNVQPCASTAFQQWSFIQLTNKARRLQVKAVEGSGTTQCLDCWKGEHYCDVHTLECSPNNNNQHFFIQIHHRQIDLDNNRIYFSISNKQHPNRCLTLYFNPTKNQESLQLQECSGSDSQSFYLDIDFAPEIERLKVIVSHLPGLISRIENALTNYDQAYGRVIHFKSQNKCLEAKWSTHGSEDRDCRGIPNCARYTPNVQPCDELSGFQQWRLSGDVIGVASKAHLVVKSRKSPCLNCDYGSKDCDINIVDCVPDHGDQKFLFRIYDRQIDLVNNRIYFSIINKDHLDRCLTLHYNSRYHGEGFKLQTCYGNDDQSFFLDIDFSQEIGDIKSKLKL